MAGYGYAVQAVDHSSRRSLTPSRTSGDHWVLTKFSRVLALALGKKSWLGKPAQPPVAFSDVIERVKQAQTEPGENGANDLRRSDHAADR